MLPYTHDEVISLEQTFSIFTANHPSSLVFLLFCCSLNHCSTNYSDSTVSCGSFPRKAVLLFAPIRPSAPYCEDSDVWLNLYDEPVMGRTYYFE